MKKPTIAVLLGWVCLLPVPGQEQDSGSAVRVTPEDIRQSVGTGNDLNRVLALDPSVYTIGSRGNNTLIVRGGVPGENVYLLDGIELNTINNFAGLDLSGGKLGFINTDLVSGVDFYKGGGSAAMPSRVSSAVDIRLRDKPGSGRHYQVNLNTYGPGAAFEQGMLDDRVYVLSNVRWVDIKPFRKWMGDQETPAYGDGLLKTVFRMNRRHTLSSLGLFSRYYYKRTVPSGDVYPFPRTSQNYFNQYAIGLSEKYDNAVVRNTLSVSAVSLYGGDSSAHQAATDTIMFESGGVNQLLVARRMYSTDYVNRFEKVSDDFSLKLTRNAALECGLYGQSSTYSYDHESGWYGGTFIDTAMDAYQAGGYAQGLAEYKGFSAVAGMRADYYSLIDKTGLSPRIEITRFSPSGKHRIWVNGGLYHQLPADNNAFFELMLWQRPHFRFRDVALQRSWQGNLGYEGCFGPSRRLRVESYFKWYDREFPFIAPEWRQYGIRTEVVDGQTVWRMSPPEGKKRAAGLELTFENTDQGGWPRSISGFVSSVKDQYTDSSWYNNRYDVQIGARLNVGRNFGSHHRLAADFCAMRGRPDMRGEGDYYSQRLNPLFLLNLRYYAEYDFSRTMFTAYVDLVNVLNQTPVVAKYYSDWPYRRINGEERLEGFFPVFGLTVKF